MRFEGPRPESAEGRQRGAGAAAGAEAAWWMLAASAAAFFWPWLPMLAWPVAAVALWRRRIASRALGVLALLLFAMAAWNATELLQAREGARPAAAARSALLEYQDTLADLEHRATSLASSLATQEVARAERQDFFRLLEAERSRGPAPAGLTLLLVDRDGVAVAWSGAGLRHDLPEAGLPTSGLHSVSSFAAVTLYAVAPLDDNRRPARVVAGRSFATSALPFGSRAGFGSELGGVPVWSVADGDLASGAYRSGDFWELVPERGPVLRARGEVFEPRELPAFRLEIAAPQIWVLLTVCLGLAAAASWRSAVAPARSQGRRDPLAPLSLALLVVLYGAGASWLALGFATAGVAFAVGATRSRSVELSLRRRAAAGAVLSLAAVAFASGVQVVQGPTSLGSAIGSSLDGWILRLGSFAVVAGATWWSCGGSARDRSRGVYAVVGTVTMAAAAALVERPLPSVLLLVLAGAALLVALGGLVPSSRLFATFLVAAGISATAWSAAEREGLRDALRERLASVVSAARGEAANG